MSWTIAADCLLAAAKRKIGAMVYEDNHSVKPSDEAEHASEVAVFNDARGVILSILEFVHAEPGHVVKVNVNVTGGLNGVTHFAVNPMQLESE